MLWKLASQARALSDVTDLIVVPFDYRLVAPDAV
jgi:hypothetical protein